MTKPEEQGATSSADAAAAAALAPEADQTELGKRPEAP